MLKEDSFEESLGEILQLKQKNEKHTILLVDDEVNNLQLLRRTLRNDYNILTASNGKEALEIVEGKGNEIALIVSDQKMPEMEGTEFLKRVTGEYPDIVKILLTGHLDVDAIVDSINDCHLYQYIVKPFDPEELKLTIETGIQKFDLVNNKTVILKDLRELFYKTIKLIASALDAKDPYTHGHSLRVTMYSLILAKALNLDDTTLEEIETAGLLHDIGKIGIPQKILCKPGRLTDEEYEVMKSHPAQAEKMLMGIKKLTVISNGNTAEISRKQMTVVNPAISYIILPYAEALPQNGRDTVSFAKLVGEAQGIIYHKKLAPYIVTRSDGMYVAVWNGQLVKLKGIKL